MVLVRLGPTYSMDPAVSIFSNMLTQPVWSACKSKSSQSPLVYECWNLAGSRAGFLRTEAKSRGLQHLIFWACRHSFSYANGNLGWRLPASIMKRHHRTQHASAMPGQFRERGNVPSLYHRTISHSQRASKILGCDMKGETIWRGSLIARWISRLKNSSWVGSWND